jgi:pseudouridylate synthase / pseudouridine kinase
VVGLQLIDRCRNNSQKTNLSKKATEPVLTRTETSSTETHPQHGHRQYEVLVAGALAADLSCDYIPLEGFEGSESPILHTSNPALFSQSIGGVGHNVALAAHYAGASTLLCSAVGNDVTGHALIEQLKQSGLPSSGVQILGADENARTAQYVAVNDTKKDLVVAMADMSILASPSLDSAEVWETLITRHKPKWVVVDSNWSARIISQVIKAARSRNARIAFEPVSAQKSSRLIRTMKPECVVPDHSLDLAAPNNLELRTMYNTAREAMFFDSGHWWQIINALNLPAVGSRDRLVQLTSADLVDQGIPQQSLQLLPYIPCILTKLGARGCLLTQMLQPGDLRLRDPDFAEYILGRSLEDDGPVGGVYMRLFPPPEIVNSEEVVSVNGVGDTLLGVLIAGLAKDGAEARVEDMIPAAQRAAVMTIRSDKAVSAEIKGILDSSR